MKRPFALCLTALLVATGCSNAPEQGDRPLVAETPDNDDTDKGGRDKGNDAKRSRSDKKPGGRSAVEPGDDHQSSGSSTISGDVDVPGANEEQQYPTASAELTEPNPDAKSQGITPDYSEMVGARVEGLGREFRVTLTFDGEIPQRMPNDKTIMVIGFQMIRGEEEGYAFAGQATDKGWKPYAGGKDKQSEFPGTFEVTGDQIVMVVPWSFVGGAYPFKWMASSNWFQSLANTTHYKFDLIPNKDQANYPG